MSPPPSSTSSSATSTATRRASSTAYQQAEAAGCDLVAFPELAVTGYPPEDLLLRPAFVAQAGETLEKIAAGHRQLRRGGRLPEAGARPLELGGGVRPRHRCWAVYRKHLLPNYSVFDEQRYFVPSTVDGPLFVVGGVRVALSICEDAWSPTGPISTQAAGARSWW